MTTWPRYRLVAAWVAATAVAACAVTVTTTPSPSLNPAGTVVATPTSSPSGPYAVLQLPSTVRTVSIDSLQSADSHGVPMPFRLHRISGFGSRVVFDSLYGPHSIWVVDLNDGSLRTLATTGETYTWTPDISANWVVWVEMKWTDNEWMQGNLSWRLMAEDLRTNRITELKWGVHARLEAGSAQPPLIRVDGDRVAYAIEHPRAGHPLGWQIVLQSLLTGVAERTIDTNRDLFSLDVSGTNICYSEGQADLDVGFKYDMRLMLSTALHPTPVEVTSDAYEAAISGERLAWMEDREAGLERSPMSLTPVIKTATVGDLIPLQISVTTRSPALPSGGGESLLGGQYPAVGDDMVSWTDMQTDGTPSGSVWKLALWDASSRVAYQVEPNPAVLFSTVEGGWLIWYNDILKPDGNETSNFHGLPLSELSLARS